MRCGRGGARADAGPRGDLTTADLVEAYRRDGVVHLPAFFDAEQIRTLREHVDRAAAAREGSSSLDDGGMTFYSLLYPLDEGLQAFVSQPRLLDLVCPLLGDDVWVRWDQAVAKRAGAPVFPWHQDNGYSRLRAEHLQAWVALTDAGPDDGCLWVVPGSHRLGLPHHHRGAHVEVDDVPEGGRPVVAAAGDLVLFSSRLVHRTTPNRSGRDRWTYVVEYLGVRELDPFVRPPYFVTSRHGAPDPRFVRWTPGRRSPRAQLAYLPERLRVRREEGTWRRGM